MIMTVAYNGSFTGDPAVGEEVLTVGTVNGRVASYVWGPDIASRPDGHSSWQRAGGVGGLLMVVDGNGTWPGIPATTDDHFFPLMDRLGNVTGCRKAATGLPNDSLSAVLEYDAFGQEVRSTGPASDLVPFHFSTKFTDQESGLNYYGYRYYDSGKGRWLNRDPIGEDGGVNLFGSLSNNLIASLDVLGQINARHAILSADGGNGGADPSNFRPEEDISGFPKQISPNDPSPAYAYTPKPVAKFNYKCKQCECSSDWTVTGDFKLVYEQPMWFAAQVKGGGKTVDIPAPLLERERQHEMKHVADMKEFYENETKIADKFIERNKCKYPSEADCKAFGVNQLQLDILSHLQKAHGASAAHGSKQDWSDIKSLNEDLANLLR